MAFILMLEDHKDWRRRLSYLLCKQGHTVIGLEKPSLALQRLHSDPPIQLAIIDLYIDGEAATSHKICLEAHKMAIPVLVISGPATRMQVAELFSRCKINDFIEKAPFDELLFLSSVKNALSLPVKSAKKVLENNKAQIAPSKRRRLSTAIWGSTPSTSRTQPPSIQLRLPRNRVKTEPQKVQHSAHLQVKHARLRIFLCHSSKDKSTVRHLHHRLKAAGFDPWLDELELAPGQDWQVEIPFAVRVCDVIIVCLSKNSVNKEGYVQKEIKLALDVEEEKPEGTIFIVPVKFEEVDVPKRLSRWQWANLFQPLGYKHLIRALNIRANTLGLSTAVIRETKEGEPLHKRSSSRANHALRHHDISRFRSDPDPTVVNNILVTIDSKLKNLKRAGLDFTGQWSRLGATDKELFNIIDSTLNQMVEVVRRSPELSAEIRHDYALEAEGLRRELKKSRLNLKRVREMWTSLGDAKGTLGVTGAYLQPFVAVIAPLIKHIIRSTA